MPSSPGAGPNPWFHSTRYHLKERLGAGSVGTVYLARDGEAGRLVALKVIHGERVSAETVAQLQHEFQVIVGLHHPQVASAYDFGYIGQDNLPFYTREFVEGAPVEAGPPPPGDRGSPQEFLKPLLDLLDALHYLHAHEILHLDIHPGNLIEARDTSRGSVLIDCGTAVLWPSASQPLIGSVLRPTSLAPELLRPEAQPGPAADLFAAGRLLLFRLTGRADAEPSLPREIPGWGPRLTLELERIASKALQPDPGRRFRSALEFREALLWALGISGGRPRLFEPGELTVGRDVELELVEGALRGAGAGEKRLILFTGPSGLGKSRLLEEARLRAQLRGLEVAHVRFIEGSASAPSLKKTLQLRARGESAAWLEPLRAEHGGTSADRARRAADAFLTRAAPPLVLLLDDLECADPESRLLAEALAVQCNGKAASPGQTDPGRGLAIIASSAREPGLNLSLPERSVVHRVRPLHRKEAIALLAAFLRPLSAPRMLLESCARAARGIPIRLRHMARSFHSEFGSRGVVPRGAEVPREPLLEESAAAFTGNRDRSERRILEALAVLQRPAGREEIAAAAGISMEQARHALGHLERHEIITVRGRGRSRQHYLSRGDAAGKLLAAIPRRRRIVMHRGAARFLERQSAKHPGRLESLARHLLAGGRRREGRKLAVEAAAALKSHGLHQGAIALLVEASGPERDRRWRIRFAEEISALHEHAGDHLEGAMVLEPAYRGKLGPLTGREAVRIRRRLGVHCHRAGFPEKALAIFEEVRAIADPAHDLEELIFVDSELAELHTLRGDYGVAEEACRRGLHLLETAWRGTKGFGMRMEVMLRASLGHLELRRMSLDRAAVELRAALKLARGSATTAMRAHLLNALGTVHNQRNEHQRARACYLRAERLLEKSGERRGLVQVSCNLATIAAKTGDAIGARDRMEQAVQLLARYPGKRLEFLVTLSRGLVAHWLGDLGKSLEAFLHALPMGKKLGDDQFAVYALIYLAEAEIGCGQIGEAARHLRAAAGQARGVGPPVVERMAYARLFLAESLLGRKRAAGEALRALARRPRTAVLLLEAWNDLYVAMGLLLAEGKVSAGEKPAGLWEEAVETFTRLGIPAGRRLARLGLLYQALARGESRAFRVEREPPERAEGGHNKLLLVLESMAEAEACLQCGQLEAADESLRAAAAAIAGQQLLEVDWRIEYLHARLAERKGDREAARRFLHRSLNARDLIARSLPARQRLSFLEQPRFQPLRELAARLERPHLTPVSLKSRGESSGYLGIIGRSAAMMDIFKTIERLTDHEVPVLICGGTGTGKDLIARAIHATSPRRAGPFLALDCASLPPELFESELFGHEAGAFTGADAARGGLLEHVAGGTLYLDELPGLSQGAQAKLLRLLDSKVFRRLGGVETRTADVRFLASSGTDLEDLVRKGLFRADLLYRVRGVEILIPLLRARRDDIRLLAAHFLEAHARRLERAPPSLASDGLGILDAHDWPGNVRELEMVLLRWLMTSSPGAAPRLDALRALIPRPRTPALINEEGLAGRSLEELKLEVERVYLIRLFRETGGDLKQMMETLGVKLPTLYRRLHAAGVNVRTLRRELR